MALESLKQESRKQEREEDRYLLSQKCYRKEKGFPLTANILRVHKLRRKFN